MRETFTRNASKLTAVFTDANDHNPLVDEDCPRCSGTGRYCQMFEENGGGYAISTCADCGGSGVTGKQAPYFSNSRPEVEAGVNDSGWVTCPECQTRFSTNDPDRWTGRRHVKCGQKIRLVRAD